jgi:hypothetical protein
VASEDPLLEPIEGADHQDFGGAAVDVVQVGSARIKRVVYPAGTRWSTDFKPLVGTELCMHAHVGFLARGELHGEYGDGCRFEFRAPQVIVIEPGHDAWVPGDQDAVLIQFDFERHTSERLGLPGEHGRH